MLSSVILYFLKHCSSLWGIWIKLGKKEDQYVGLNSAWNCYLVLLMQSTHRLHLMMMFKVMTCFEIFTEICFTEITLAHVHFLFQKKKKIFKSHLLLLKFSHKVGLFCKPLWCYNNIHPDSSGCLAV